MWPKYAQNFDSDTFDTCEKEATPAVSDEAWLSDVVD